MDEHGKAGFTDSAGRMWSTAITYGTIRRVKNATGFDLTDLANKEGIEKVSSDVFLFVDLLWWIIQPQADAAGVTSDLFFESLLDDHLTQAMIAVHMGLADFFPKDRGAILRMVARKEQKAVERLNRQASAMAEKLESQEVQEQLDQAIENELAKLSGDSAGSSAVSSGLSLGT